MDANQIKQTVSMRDVIGRYGFKPNRAGFIHCPFHQDNGHASLKIYKKDFHCYGCGMDGDIFTFVQEMEHCDFKTAYLSLGGEYEKKTSWQRKKFEYEQKLRKEQMQRQEQADKNLKKQIIRDISLQKLFIKLSNVYSDDWCASINKLEYDFYLLDELTKKGVRLID